MRLSPCFGSTTETQPNDVLMTPETQPNETNDVMITPDTQPNDVMMTPETEPNDGMMTPEMQPNNVMMTPETQPNDGTITPETQPNNVMMTPETQPNDGMITPETQPNDVMMTPEQPNDGMISPEMQPNEVITSETQVNDVLITSETQPNNVLTIPETHSNNVLITSEIRLNNEVAVTESQPNNELAIADTQPNSELAIAEIHSNNELAMQETHPNNELPIQETHPNNQLSIHEMYPNNELVIQDVHPNNELSFPETQPDNMLAITQPNNEVTSQETQPNKRRKKKSIVWEHFTIETVSAGCRRACCKQCKQSFAYSTGSKVAGTSHLKRHIAKGTCPGLLRNQGNNQLTPYTPRMGGSEPPKRRYRSPSVPYISFDQDRCRHEIARMIIMHNYPLHMVEHPGFITFVQNLQPRFDKVSFNTVQGDCVATYLREKQSLMKFIEGIPGRFCLTLDLWTSSQSLGYVFITGHFVDTEWRLQKRTLNVMMEPYPRSDSAFSHAVAACLSDWSLEGKLFSLTFSHSLSEAGFEHLRALLCIKNNLVLNGQLLLRNCIARTFSSMAKVVLEAGQGTVKKIRDSVKYVKISESHEEKFLELKQQLQVPSEKSLSIDDQTKWDTTYQMLVAASELKEVFSCLDTSDPDYKEAPSMEDWKLAETLCAFLKPLFDSANILTTTTNPTAIIFFHEAWKIHSDLTRAVMNEDPFVSNVTKAMLEKIDKYWKDCCFALAIAVVLDPRFKMKLVEFSFTKLYGEDAPAYIKIVDDGIHELFEEYVTLPLPLTPAFTEEGNAGVNVKSEESQGGSFLSDNGLIDFDMYIMETTSQQMKSELDQYLDESLLPRVHDFDVLGWWKLNKLKYPTLSKMARDILSIPVSSVAVDSVFDTVNKEMDQYRSSLRPETVEALICAKDWFQYSSPEVSNALVKMEV
ncbi:zinc finger BED domain-containing protein DAYSLEEPER-like isoform X2 [Mangifera indica]|uniref:zinc finger BED domain-containing protein DAYSLEEPER-like isoform X2 n=1 Tax=Mangifera indica TaxID=29780 RepID=UPI001CF9672C|nr:zinc finger BED domain-containing protein DAYSLEEPER-like isoform X2 [Mangifera indica]